MPSEITNKQLRFFGFTVAGIFALIGFWRLIVRAEDPRWWALVAAFCLLVPAVVFPKSLFWPCKGWTVAGHVLDWTNTRIILSVVFYVIVTPIGALRRWLEKDPMGQQLRPDLGSYRVVRELRPASHLTKQY
jgi:hypothetical protein